MVFTALLIYQHVEPSAFQRHDIERRQQKLTESMVVSGLRISGFLAEMMVIDHAESTADWAQASSKTYCNFSHVVVRRFKPALPAEEGEVS